MKVTDIEKLTGYESGELRGKEWKAFNRESISRAEMEICGFEYSGDPNENKNYTVSGFVRMTGVPLYVELCELFIAELPE